MSAITTHILDVSRGRPAADVAVSLERVDDQGSWQVLGRATTDPDGRVRSFPGAAPLRAGVHRLRFDIAPYFMAHQTPTFYPFVEIVFEVSRPNEHHHVPLLLSPFGYSTYRGS